MSIDKKARTEPLIDDIPQDEDKFDRMIHLLESIEFHLSTITGFPAIGISNDPEG